MEIKPYLKSFGISFMSMSCLLSLVSIPSTLASDHVDSPSVSVAGPTYAPVSTSPKPTVASGKPEDITDVYAFREQDQSGNIADAGKLCLVMTLNGLQSPGQGRPFAPDVAYQIMVSTDKNNLTANAKMFSFRFGLPDLNTGLQQIYLSNTSTPSTTSIGTTTAFNSSANVVSTSYGGQPIKVFAGEMDDPFFLDFRVINEGLAFGVNGTGSTNTARTPGDTFGASNVNAIVVSVPMTAISATSTTFYVWGRTLR